MARQFVTTASVVMFIADGITDQQAFEQLNKTANAIGVNFVFPLTPQDRTVIIAHVDKTT